MMQKEEKRANKEIPPGIEAEGLAFRIDHSPCRQAPTNKKASIPRLSLVAVRFHIASLQQMLSAEGVVSDTLDPSVGYRRSGR